MCSIFKKLKVLPQN